MFIYRLLLSTIKHVFIHMEAGDFICNIQSRVQETVTRIHLFPRFSRNYEAIRRDKVLLNIFTIFDM